MSLCRPIQLRRMAAGGVEVNVRGRTMIYPKATLEEISAGVKAYDDGMKVQDAFPEPLFSADEREFLMTGITPEEWEDMRRRQERAEAEDWSEEGADEPAF